MAGATVRVTNIPPTAIAEELSRFFSSTVGPVFACEIASHRKNWRSRGFGRVQFESPDAANLAIALSSKGTLPHFQGARLDVIRSLEDMIPRGSRVDATLRLGVLASEREMEVFGSWDNVRAEVIEGRKKMEILVEDGGESYKLEIMFGDIDASYGCRFGGKGKEEANAVLLKLKYAPRIYKRICGPTLNTKFGSDRYHICKEKFEFLWVRAPDFSSANTIGRSCSLCLELANGMSSSKVFSSLPCYEELGHLTLTEGDLYCSSSMLVPIISCPHDSVVAYEILFQLNSLVHMQKISCKQLSSNLFDILSGLSLDTAMKILMKMHKLHSICYEPLRFIQSQVACVSMKQKTDLSNKNSHVENLMSCYRVLVTPSKVYFQGPELETCNYVINHYAKYASDFLRVSFVDEDWNKLPSDAVSATTEQGMFSKPYKTGIYHRILSILRDGIVIGPKKFEFLAFSASQLRANSVWMFASNDNVTAESIREWMGHFKKIRSVSKCAARMGQLFSSSRQTVDVLPHDVQIIPDIEVMTDGIKYCFSDGIGKISYIFAKRVAQKCGLKHVPSAFQIRYGGYKGVIAVDRTSYRKLSLRRSMLKFDSSSTMLNVTKWSERMPCYLNREIISLLSTLGIEDDIFESMQNDQMNLLDEMLTNREAALIVLNRMAGADIRILVKMLTHGYDPNSEPYLSMMLRAYREYQLSDIRSKCRIFVPKGRVLIGCLDETGTLDYGQVYLRVTVKEDELQSKNQSFFENIDQSTAVVVGKVVVTKNPCLHPGDIRVLQAVYAPQLDETDLVDCIVFPQKGERPHPNECSGGDLDGDIYFISWDEKLVPAKTETPMDYIGRRPRQMDHDVTVEEIHKFFVDYMINDSLGVISTTHLVHADREEKKARSPQCLQLANLHSMAVDYAKTGAPAEMPRKLRPKEFPDFMERWDRPTYISTGVLGKLYRAAADHISRTQNSEEQPSYDYDLEVNGFEAFLPAAEELYAQYVEKLTSLMTYYGAEHEHEILTGNLRNRSTYLQRDKKRYEEMKDRILVGVKSLHKEVEGWFRSTCNESEQARMASAWYNVTYHRRCNKSEAKFLSFPWIVGDVLLIIKASKVVDRKVKGETMGVRS